MHGFGFSFALRQTLQFAGSHLLTSLLSFNVGVELGQLLVLVLLIPALDLLFRYVVAERIGTIILSALVGAHGVALDGRAVGAAAQVHVRVAGARRRVSRRRAALDDAAGGRRGLYWLVFGVLKPAENRNAEV